MITRIEATNYRCFEKADVDLSDFAVLVGANGAGKTTLLDIPSVIAECMVAPSVGQVFVVSQNNQVQRCTSLQDIPFQGTGVHFILTLEAKLPEHVVEQLVPVLAPTYQAKKERWWSHIRYEVRFEIFNKVELTVADEHLFLFPESSIPKRNGIRVQGEYNNKSWRTIIRRMSGGQATLRVESRRTSKAKKLSIAQTQLALPKVQYEAPSEYPAAAWFFDLVCRKSLFYRPDLEKLQVASPPGLSKELMLDGSNLPWLALELQKNETRFQYWVSHVKTALPQIENITAKIREEDHHAYFIISYQGGYTVTSSGLSEGTLKILALTLVPYLENLPSLIRIEEPENGIHPRAIEAVLQSLSSVYGSQIVISSHSPIVLAQSKLSQLLCARLADNGAATLVKGKEHPQLKDWQGKVDLGALFASGVLG